MEPWNSKNGNDGPYLRRPRLAITSPSVRGANANSAPVMVKRLFLSFMIMELRLKGFPLSQLAD